MFDFLLNGVILVWVEGRLLRLRPGVFWSVFSLSGSTQPFAPRFGAGRATALCAAVAVWCVGYLLAAVTPFALNLFPARLLVIGLVVGLVEVSVGTLAGAWIY